MGQVARGPVDWHRFASYLIVANAVPRLNVCPIWGVENGAIGNLYGPSVHVGRGGLQLNGATAHSVRGGVGPVLDEASPALHEGWASDRDGLLAKARQHGYHALASL